MRGGEQAMWVQQQMWVKRNEHGVIIGVSDNPPSNEDFIPTLESEEKEIATGQGD